MFITPPLNVYASSWGIGSYLWRVQISNNSTEAHLALAIASSTYFVCWNFIYSTQCFSGSSVSTISFLVRSLMEYFSSEWWWGGTTEGGSEGLETGSCRQPADHGRVCFRSPTRGIGGQGALQPNSPLDNALLHRALDADSSAMNL